MILTTTWVLIFVVNSTFGATRPTVIKGFKDEQECRQAGEKMEKDIMFLEFSCVEMKMEQTK